MIIYTKDTKICSSTHFAKPVNLTIISYSKFHLYFLTHLSNTFISILTRRRYHKCPTLSAGQSNLSEKMRRASMKGKPAAMDIWLPKRRVIIPKTPPKLAAERKNKGKESRKEEIEEFTLAEIPSILLNVLTDYGLDASTLAKLEATYSVFRRPAQDYPDGSLPLTELAAFDICKKRALFKLMTSEERETMKQRCGGSWKLVLRFILAGEECTRRGNAVAVAGPGHSIVITKSGDVYSFGSNSFGQLGNGTTVKEAVPRLISSLQGIRIVQASAEWGRTILISDTGSVYSFGQQASGELKPKEGVQDVLTPQLVESLRDIFVVQVAVGNWFTAYLSREGNVYTVSWGKDKKLGHQTDREDFEPRPLLGALENLPVVQIAAGNCFLLALVCQPSGMSVYSVGCGLGGKLGHKVTDNETQPRLIEEFQTLNFQPKMISAGPWHSVVLGADGRVCTWGWGNCGCLGHGDEEFQLSPKVVSALDNIKASHVAAGNYFTFVVSNDGDVYSFGYGGSPCLGHKFENNVEGAAVPQSVLMPKLVNSIKKLDERIIHVNVTNSVCISAHTFVLAESGKLYSFGVGGDGQLGYKLKGNSSETCSPELVNINLS